MANGGACFGNKVHPAQLAVSSFQIMLSGQQCSEGRLRVTGKQANHNHALKRTEFLIT